MKRRFNQLLQWYFSRNALPYWCILLFDMLTMLFAGIFTYWIFIYNRDIAVDVIKLFRTLCMYVLPMLVGARMFHTYSGIARYSSSIDLANIAYAGAVSLIVAYAWHFYILTFPTEVFYHLYFRHIVLMYIIGTALIWSSRLLVKTLYDVLTTNNQTLRTLIYGIKEGFNWTFKGYSLDVDVRKYKYVNYSYGYGYYVTMGYKDQETKEAASREMEKLFNIVVREFRDLGIELTQSQGESWVRAEKTIGDMHYLVALNKPVEIDGKVFNEDYYVSIGINKPL